MEVSPIIRDRIFAAADELYAISGSEEFPTVDAVRKHAKSNMNDTCSAMKDWRRKQSVHVDLVPIEVPPSVQAAGARSLQTLWEEATAVANEALRAAQLAWQVERNESDIVREQLADAFNHTERELEDSRSALDDLQAQYAHVNETLLVTQRQCEQLMHDNAAATASAERATALRVEVERRADDLRRELDQVYAALANAHDNAAEARRLAAHDLVQARLALEQQRQHMATGNTAQR